MLKNKKGVSLITLVITIVVMLIVLTITISSSLKSVDETNATRIENEIRNLKDAVNDRMTNYERNPMMYPIIGEKIGDTVFEYIRSIENMESQEISNVIAQISENYSSETADYYRLVGRTEAEKLGVESLDIEHYYVVDYNECEVYGPVSIKLVNP